MQNLPKRTIDRIGRRIWRMLWIVPLFCLLFPVRYTTLKICFIASLLGLWLGAWLLFRERRWVRIACIVAGLGIILPLSLPGRPADPVSLRRAYVTALLPYRGTLYVWGGGNHLGIDCSGLVQRGLIDADFGQGMKTGNPGLLRQGVALWWHNRSAQALGEGYRGETRLLFQAPSLNQTDYTAILPGDIAVLSDGVHTLAYVGNRTWIEANPAPMRVVLAQAPSRDAYFNMPVRLMRWSQLEAKV